MVSSALDKMARGTAWKDRQVLIVDLPPGTGDAQARGLGGGGGGGGCLWGVAVRAMVCLCRLHHTIRSFGNRDIL